MNVLYLCYWSIGDPLSQATVFPNISRLASIFRQVVVVSIERDGGINEPEAIPPALKNVTYLQIDYHGSGLAGYIKNLYQSVTRLCQLTNQYSINVFLGRGAPAGGLLYLVWLKTRTPYYVESFEPHANYMLESGVWSRFGLKYNFQLFLERRQIKAATGLMPVSNNFKDFILKKGFPPGRVKTVPCVINLEKFQFEEVSRNEIRSHLKIQADDVVGIYVGKFGGIYYEVDEALALFKQDFDYFDSKFHLILLTNYNKEVIKEKSSMLKLPLDRIHVSFKTNDVVPKYLSASDFGYALIKPSPSKKYCSAIKIGEYLANGLPVVLPPGIGDDSDYLENKGFGCFIRSSNYDRVNLLRQFNKRKQIMMLAQETRSPFLADIAYDYFFKHPNE